MPLHLHTGVLYFNANLKTYPKNWVPATMVRPTAIHHNKSADTYDSAMRCIVWKCNLENESEIHIITNSEPALTVACLKSFNKCSLLRCTRHFEGNCKDILIDMEIKGNMKDAMLDVVFDEHGFVEAKNKQNLKEKMKDAITLLSEIEKQCLPQNELLNNNALFHYTLKVGRRQFSGKL